jgi:hypothetical protein
MHFVRGLRVGEVLKGKLSMTVLRMSRAGACALLCVGALTASVSLSAVAPAFGASSGIHVSSNADRSGAVALDGATVSADTHVFYSGSSVDVVTFYIDLKGSGSSQTWESRTIEKIAPYDLAGTAENGKADDYDTDDLGDGQHVVTAVVRHDDGSETTEKATFKVANNSTGSAAPSGHSIISADFDGESTGAVSPDSFNDEVGKTNTNAGAYTGMTYEPDSRGSGKVVRTFLAAGKFHQSPAPGNGNVLFVTLPGSYDKACMSYDVKFSSGFDFSLGGKLPGLLGVAPGVSPGTPTGGGSTDSGWSGRVMWLGPDAYSIAGEGGNDNMGATYLYHSGQSGTYGDNLWWHKPFVDGRWHHVKQCHSMNTIGQSNGVMQAWFDGSLVINDSSVKYRTKSDVHITHFDWNIFRGGNTSAWAGSRDGYVDMDNLSVTTG